MYTNSQAATSIDVVIFGQYVCYTPKRSTLKDDLSGKLNETAFRSLKKPRVYQISDRYFDWCSHFQPGVFEKNEFMSLKKTRL